MPAGADGNEIVRNTYWLSPAHDIPGQAGIGLDGVFWTKPESTAGFVPSDAIPPSGYRVTLEAWNDLASGES